MNEHQRQTEFLRQCVLYDDSAESQRLAERIRQLQQNERCVRRAVWLMTLLAALAFAVLGYLAVFVEDFPQNLPGFMSRFIAQGSCVAGLASLICITAFLGLEVVYRQELAQRREECRRLATKLFESRLGKLRTTTRSQVVKQRQVFELVESSPEPELGQGAAGVMELTVIK